MTEALLWIAAIGITVNAVLLVALLVRSSHATRRDGQTLRDELRMGREESQRSARELREELAAATANAAKQQQVQVEAMTRQLRDLAESNQTSLDRIRSTFDLRVRELQESNERRLEEMRKTVDEKLHDTLEKRLGESFQLVSQRLEAVQKGLGEMQSLATGVGDLKRVLTNVKTRGTWAEVQLGALLDQILAPGQYERNVQTKENTREVVEFAIRLPGARNEPGSPVWLPIDSKFPQEDYLRIQEAAERGDPDGAQKAAEALARTVRSSAQEIHDKYLNPPRTTDFAVMFLATEGLYAEVLRHPTLVEEIQRSYRIVVAGPTTLAAILSSFRLGFQTLAIEQHATEVRKLLGAVKTEFAKFGGVLERVRKQLHTASRTIDEAGIRTRAMERKLRDVEQLPEPDARKVLELPEREEPEESTLEQNLL